MARRANLTEEDRKLRKNVMLYIGEHYLESFNNAVEKSGAETRYEYIKALMVQDLVRRGILDVKEIPRSDLHLLEV